MQSLGLLLPIALLSLSALLNAAVLLYFGIRMLNASRSRRKPPVLMPTPVTNP